MELTVESLVAELGLTLVSGLQSAQAQHARRASLQARRRLTEQWA